MNHRIWCTRRDLRLLVRRLHDVQTYDGPKREPMRSPSSAATTVVTAGAPVSVILRQVDGHDVWRRRKRRRGAARQAHPAGRLSHRRDEERVAHSRSRWSLRRPTGIGCVARNRPGLRECTARSRLNRPTRADAHEYNPGRVRSSVNHACCVQIRCLPSLTLLLALTAGTMRASRKAPCRRRRIASSERRSRVAARRSRGRRKSERKLMLLRNGDVLRTYKVSLGLAAGRAQAVRGRLPHAGRQVPAHAPQSEQRVLSCRSRSTIRTSRTSHARAARA